MREQPEYGKPDSQKNPMFSESSKSSQPQWVQQLNWPNRLTLLRIFLVPFLLICLLSPQGWYPIVAASIFLLAAATDWLDGHLARSLNQITRLGQLLDPIADKLLVTAALVALVERQLVPAWMVAIIVCREIAITGLRAVAAGQDIIIAADTFGKYKMLCLIIGAFLLMLNVPMLYVPGVIALSVGLVLGVISGVEYMRSYLSKIL
jgi:CDP-diacylglycerol--glycerol-3-phosphate 3-phosphatidyltransferase